MTANWIMNTNPIWRLIVWLLLVTLEAVIGLPWLSLWLGNEWVSGLAGKPALVTIGLVVMAFVLASLYGLPLILAGLVVVGLWQGKQVTRRYSVSRWFYWFVAGLVVGVAARIELSLLTISWTVISYLLIFRTGVLAQFKKLWQKNSMALLRNQVRRSDSSD
ncbi:MAG TPA: hypothetical protein VGA89_00420 [Patescibacteria group bacterium]|jgi:hypothetical protein